MMHVDEVTKVEILCDQNLFEQALKDGKIVMGTAVKELDELNELSNQIHIGTLEGIKAKERDVRRIRAP